MASARISGSVRSRNFFAMIHGTVYCGTTDPAQRSRRQRQADGAIRVVLHLYAAKVGDERVTVIECPVCRCHPDDRAPAARPAVRPRACLRTRRARERSARQLTRRQQIAFWLPASHLHFVSHRRARAAAGSPTRRESRQRASWYGRQTSRPPNDPAGKREQQSRGAGDRRLVPLLRLLERVEPRRLFGRGQVRRDQLHRLERPPAVRDREDGRRSRDCAVPPRAATCARRCSRESTSVPSMSNSTASSSNDRPRHAHESRSPAGVAAGKLRPPV